VARPARTWTLVAGISVATALALMSLATFIEHRAPEHEAFHSAPIPKIDVHQHVGPRTLPDAMRLGGRHGIRALVNLSGGYAGEDLEEQIAAAGRYPGRVLVFMNVDFRDCCGPGWADRETARLARGKTLGARGLKIYKELGLGVRDSAGRVPVDSPKLDPLWNACERLSLPVAIHAADPKAFFEPLGPANERWEELRQTPQWSFEDRGRYPAWQVVFDEFVRLVERHPRLTFIGVHFGNDAEDPAEVARLLGRLPNLYVDTAARVPELGRRAEATRAAILAHPDRVLFGTDMQWVEGPGMKAVILGAGPPASTMDDVRRFFEGTFRFLETLDRGIESPTPIQGGWKLDGIGLPRDVLEQVYHRNAERLLGIRLEDGA
jgi:predicted TIM-barrel fold metal-dependent hydrolase